MTISIKMNNCATNDPCAICGSRTDPEIGPELFLAGSFAVVCWSCAEKESPVLLALLKAYRELEWARARERGSCEGDDGYVF